MHYKVSLGVRSIVITLLVSLILFLLTALFIYLLINIKSPGSRFVCFIVVISMISIYALLIAHRPTGYILEDQRLIVTRPKGNVIIPLHEITDTFIIRSGTIGSIERVGGNGGCFGFFGQFNTAFGMATFYVTRLDKLVMLYTKNYGKIVLSPDDPSLVKYIKTNMKIVCPKSY